MKDRINTTKVLTPGNRTSRVIAYLKCIKVTAAKDEPYSYLSVSNQNAGLARSKNDNLQIELVCTS